ncbi:ABC transporter ATP-binding protein [Georgenia alba]|uniref:ABC transporter ATP-binding protein n=1 Tax=Georgenia alba TaxID=2233858 RepID=A0ABW2Q7G1_9MICO
MVTDGLTVRGLTVRYGGTTAVAGVDLDVQAGEVVALLGPSGSGKSSLLRAIAGLEPPPGGTVRWNGTDVTDLPVHRRGFGLLFQDGQLFPHRSVAGNVGYGLTGRPRDERASRVAELLGLVGLEGYERRAITSLSGGQAQRVALARSLAPAPRLLLLDEPLSALDRGLRERLTGDLCRILRATGTTALYVTHDHDEAFTVADRVAVLIDGRLVQVERPAQIWRAPAGREVAAFLGYGPFLPAELDGASARTVLGEVPADRALAPGSGVLVGLGPEALRVAREGMMLPVVATRFVRGRTEVDVCLPDGQVATAVAPGGCEPAERVGIRLQGAGTVVVPA